MNEKYLSDEELLQKFYSGITEEEARVAVNAINMFCRDKTSYPLKSTENILPRPVIRDDNGKIIKDYSPCDFYLKLQEEIFEVMEVQADFDRDWNSRTYDDIAEEIVDVITVCISQLEVLGYDENKRSKLFAKVNDKNEKRGYFKESD